jgi:hypothetical protein
MSSLLAQSKNFTAPILNSQVASRVSTCERTRQNATLPRQRSCLGLLDDRPRENPLSESKHDETFKVVDRRLFTAEGELRKEVAEQQDREREVASTATPERILGGAPPTSAATVPAPNIAKAEPEPATPAAQPAAETPKRSPAFENLVRSLGQNAAMLLGGYADPRTGQPMLDLEGAREMIDMLDVLREKTMGNLAPEEDALLLDVLGNLKLAFMEMTKAATAAAMQDKVKSRT